MMQAWTVFLPHCVFAWLARRECEVLNQAGLGLVVMPRSDVLLATGGISDTRKFRPTDGADLQQGNRPKTPATQGVEGGDQGQRKSPDCDPVDVAKRCRRAASSFRATNFALRQAVLLDEAALCIDRLAAAKAEGRRKGLEEAAKVADAYADENFAMATDTIFTDPVLAKFRLGSARTVTLAEERISEGEQTKGVIHSSMAHAAQNIAAAIRALAKAEER